MHEHTGQGFYFKSDIAELAVKQYGSIEEYAKASEKNLEKFKKRRLLQGGSKLIDFCNQANSGLDMGENYWDFMADTYLSNSAFIDATDKKYGKGAAEFIGKAIKAHFGP